MTRATRLIVRAGVFLALLSNLPGGGLFRPHAAAQPPAGEICVATFADLNGNGARDEGEPPLAGVNVNLSTGGVIIATHITAEGEAQHCFASLLRGVYTITFTDSPTYRPTTASEGTFALDSGQRLTLDPFGAVPVSLGGLRNAVAAQVAAAQGPDEPLDASTRLLLATVASMMVMLFMVGMGAVILGLRSGRRPPRAAPVPPPRTIAPPPPRSGPPGSSLSR